MIDFCPTSKRAPISVFLISAISSINLLLLPSFNKTDLFLNRGTGSVRNSKNQDVCHIAFGSKVLGPPPLSGRRNNLRMSSEVGARVEDPISSEWQGREGWFPVWGWMRQHGGLRDSMPKQKAWISFEQKLWTLKDLKTVSFLSCQHT